MKSQVTGEREEIQRLFLGEISEISGQGVEVEFSGVGDGASVTFGDYVLADARRSSYLGQVNEVRREAATHERPARTVGIVKLMATYDKEEQRTRFGVSRFPEVGTPVYTATIEEVRAFEEAGSRFTNRGLLINFARLAGTTDRFLEVTPEQLFGRHLAIVGSTGSGKSWSTARLIEECTRFNSKVILFDPTGEYVNLNSGSLHLHVGKEPNVPKHSHEVSLPYFQLTESDLFAIFKPAGENQAPKLRAAMKSLKLARYATGLAPDGTIVKSHKPKQTYEEEYENFRHKIENPLAKFDIKNLTRQIQNECVDFQQSALEPKVWGGPNGYDLACCTPLITRINDIIHNPSLAPIFHPETRNTLLDAIFDFLNSPADKGLIVSLKNLSFAYNAREIVMNAIGRFLLELGRSGSFTKHPLLVVVDEAHQFLSGLIGSEGEDYPLDAFGLIAKEGRKYGLTLCLATQRPRDIPEGILSQMGTFVVHRLINDHDRKVIERASSGGDGHISTTVPTLEPGQAIMLGVGFSMPMLVSIDAPHAKPVSDGPNYQQAWAAKKGSSADNTH